MNAPPRTAIEAGAAGVVLGTAAGGEIISRFAVITCPSRGRNHIELDLESSLDLRGPHGARRRTTGDVLTVDPVEHVILYAVVNERMHLHEPIERGARRFQQQLEISEYDVRLAGERAMAALARSRIDRQHAGTEDEPARADGRRLMVSVMLPQVEAGQRRRNDFTHAGCPAPFSVRQLRDPGQQEALDISGRLYISQPDQSLDQRIHLCPRDLAGAIEEIVAVEEVVGFLHVLRLLAADLDQNAPRLGAIG